MPGRLRQYFASAGERRGAAEGYPLDPTMDGDP